MSFQKRNGTNEMPKLPTLDRKSAVPFLGAAVIWLALGSALCLWASRGTGVEFRAWAWLVGIWGLCVLDLLALARVVLGMLAFAGGGSEFSTEKKAALGVQTSVWGILKLVCLGTLGATVFVGRNIPSISLLAGLGTLIVVPLAGGFWWSQKVLSHA
jgi:hypothetical protein